ncbi:MAG: hypothetical protein H0W33_00955 [Gammaproteobacteria bacterium]|nr:hypothetical protein [Gammaproteobacteria bacterium]
MNPPLPRSLKVIRRDLSESCDFPGRRDGEVRIGLRRGSGNGRTFLIERAFRLLGRALAHYLSEPVHGYEPFAITDPAKLAAVLKPAECPQ